MEDEPRQATDDKPEFISFEYTGEDDYEEEETIERLKGGSMDIAKKVVAELHEANKLSNLEFLARGGYQHVWLVTYSMKSSKGGAQASKDKKFVLRVSRETPSLQPYQVRHDVACLHFLAKNLPTIPAPKVYAWDDGSDNSGPSFVAEEFIDGQRLSVVWPQLTEEQKTNISREIANVVADLGETRFQSIGGLALESSAGPTIEAAKVFNSRVRMTSPTNSFPPRIRVMLLQDLANSRKERVGVADHYYRRNSILQCYNIGPYTDSKDYVLSRYDREIYYYTHAAKTDIIAEAFEKTSVADFVNKLKLEREALLNDETVFQDIDTEPLVLVHEDFHAGNMLVRDGHLVGIVEWEFSGVYPLSELLGPIDILQISTPGRYDFTEEEVMKWQERYRQDVEHDIRQRGWRNQDIAAVMSDEHRVLQKARSIMFPEEWEDELGDEG